MTVVNSTPSQALPILKHMIFTYGPAAETFKVQTCQHCGKELPVVVYAYCPWCRESLDPVDTIDIVDPIPPRKPPVDRPKVMCSALLEYRKAPPTFGQLVRKSSRSLAIFTALLCSLAGINYLFGVPWMSAFVIGAMCGMVLRDLKWLYVTAGAWSIQQESMDWDKIERLARDDSPDGEI